MDFPQPYRLRSADALNRFDCGNLGMSAWLKRHALQAQFADACKTFVINKDGEIIGYYSLKVGQIETSTASRRIAQGLGKYPIPIIILARLAVDLAYQSKGIGRVLLLDAIRRTLFISESVGVRALITHPIDASAAQFYSKFGFEPAPFLETRYLALLLKDARRLINHS